MKKKKFTRLICLIAVLALAFCAFTAADCNKKNEPLQLPELAVELKTSLKVYLDSDDFEKSVLTANSAQARLPLMYLKYIDADFYSTDNVVQFKKYLNFINDLIDGGELADCKYSASPVAKQGWYGLPDFLYTYSFVYNQYLKWCDDTDTVDNSMQLYIPIIERYLKKVDGWLETSYTSEEEYEGKKIGDPFILGYNIVNNATSASLGVANYPLSWWQGLLEVVEKRTSSDKGHKEFLDAYARAEAMTSAELREYKSTLVNLWKDVCPVSVVSFGYSIFNVLPLIAANFGLENATPYCDSYMLSYYEKDVSGKFKKDGGTPNWVGFSGRPLAGSLYRGNEKYDLAYEKTMQGYFPFTDGWNQPLEEMVNMDRLCNYYNQTLQTGASVSPQYGLLYGMMNGIDMENYKKEAPDAKFDETGEETFNLITLWRNSLKKDKGGKYVIESFTDMAVAVAYVAKCYGIAAPTPLGAYSSSLAVIEL